LKPSIPHIISRYLSWFSTLDVAIFIELDDGKIYRKPLHLMVKTHGFPVDFPNKTNPLPFWVSTILRQTQNAPFFDENRPQKPDLVAVVHQSCAHQGLRRGPW
jgi:hypothetical protein